MKFPNFFKKTSKSASTAKERLRIIVTHERIGRESASSHQPAFMEAMKQDIIKVAQKYVQITAEDIEVNFEKEGDNDILSLSINLPDTDAHHVEKPQA